MYQTRVNIVAYSVDPYEDQFEKKASARKEQIAKNEYQRLKNISRAGKGGAIKGNRSSFVFVVELMIFPQLRCLLLALEK